MVIAFLDDHRDRLGVEVFNDPQLGRGLYGARKVPAQLVREGGVDGVSVSRRHVVKYTNQQLTSAEVIAELVELAKEIAAEGRRGAQFTPPLRSTSLPSTTLSASTRRRWT